jgi:fibronectin type 3 domain-containing protein
MTGDTMTNYYLVYLWDAVDRRYTLLATPKITTNRFDFVVTNPISAGYQFCVTAASHNKVESINSAAAVAHSRSMVLPAVQISKIVAEGNQVHIEWDGYPAIADVKGFSIQLNGQPLQPDTLLSADARAITLPDMPQGVDTFVIRAITNDGVSSPTNQPASVTIAPPPSSRSRRVKNGG